MQIQEYLIAAIQNIEVLLRYGEQPKKSLFVKVNQVKGVIKGVIQPILASLNTLGSKPMGLCHWISFVLNLTEFRSQVSSKERFGQQPVEM